MGGWKAFRFARAPNELEADDMEPVLDKED